MPTTKRFGTFFRAKRTALGLPLREFCRRNGLDPGNISRLERGIAAPPRSAEVLNTYAKALKLAPASEDWHTLYELAAVETGTIPSQVVKDRAAHDALPKMFRTLRGGTRRSEPWINAVDLEGWADYLDARQQLPRLVRRLIHATSNSVERIELAAGEGSERRGWDGLVRAAEGAAYVPVGLSLWELGVSREPARKAEEDFRSRMKNAQGIEPAEATYIFVTPRRWEGKSAWEKEKNELAKWKEVRVYDADSLEAWLELAPAVDTWFARLLGKKTEGMLDIDEYWKNLTALTEPNLNPKVFLISRDPEAKRLEEWLTGPVSPLAVEARSPAEVIDFLAAHIANLDETKRDALASRIVIVEDRTSWGALADEKQSLILVAKTGFSLEAETVAEAVRKGHRVLLCSERFATGQTETLMLSHPYVYDLDKALQESGFDEEKARRYAMDCGGSLTVLKRRLSRFPATSAPDWSRTDRANDLAPLVLIGSWHDAGEGDQDIVGRITGRSYAEVAELVGQMSLVPDPPIIRVSTTWSLTSREDSWILLARFLREEQFCKWEDAAIESLSADDPGLNLPPGQQSWSKMHGMTPTFSESIRTGIAETLSLLASHSGELSSQCAGEANRVERIIDKILGNAPGWKRWASLGRQLPLLAEAAPDAFLSAIEAELDKKNSEIAQLFAGGDDPLFSRCLHAGLLWAIETIAWAPTYLARASLVLARLAERDPGGKWANRPANSLMEIFLPWLPHTTVGVEERIKVIRKVTEKYPKAGWKLLLDLLPSLHSVSSPTHRPKWRDWAANWRQRVSNREYWKQAEACGQRLLEMAEGDSDRWSDLIEHIDDLSPDTRQNAIVQLLALDVAAMSMEQRSTLTMKLRRMLGRHRSYPDARWAMPGDAVSELEKALAHIEPGDPIAKNAWLFANWPELPERRREDWSGQEEDDEISRRRRKALAEVFESGGMKQILQLAGVVENPYIVGFELASTCAVYDDAEIVPGLLDDGSTSAGAFARGYAAARFAGKKWDWISRLSLGDWSSAQVASLALALPKESRTWDLLERHGEVASASYWGSVFNLFNLKDTADVVRAVAKLHAQGRPFTAMRTLDMALHNKIELAPSLLMDSLEAGLQNASEKPINDMGYTIPSLFQELQAHAFAVDEGRLAKLEWAYLGVLNGHPASPTTLHRALASDPKFFANLLELLFRSRSQPEAPQRSPTEEEQSRARTAYELLHSWETVPGLNPDKMTVDEDALRKWVATARELCATSGRLEVCDSQIGEVLAYAPAESDETWPCIPVRDIIEETESEELCNGIVIGTLNKRGVYSKSVTQGGDEERALANQYAGFAKACEVEWPRTAGALRDVARHYEAHARREDAEAEARRLGR